MLRSLRRLAGRSGGTALVFGVVLLVLVANVCLHSLLLGHGGSESEGPIRPTARLKGSHESHTTNSPSVIGHAKGGLNLQAFLPGDRAARDQAKMDFVKEMAVFAWSGYVKHAWGHDDLEPVTRTPYDWYHTQNLLNTPVDSLDTLYIMGLHEEYSAAKELILANLDFDKVTETISLFETIIRIVGGLLAAYDLEGDERLLRKCVDLVDRVLPAFDTPTGFPHNFYNLSSQTADPRYQVGLAEIGTLQLEFQYLTDITGNPVYAEKALYVFDQMQTMNVTVPGLFPEYLNSETFAVYDSKYSIGGMSDSYYEYLLKLWLSTGEEKYFQMYYTAAQAIATYMVQVTPENHLYIPPTTIYQYSTRGQSKEDIRIHHTDQFEHLACFGGGMFATGALASRRYNWTAHLDVGKRLTDFCWALYENTETGIGPEMARASTLEALIPSYILRPEAIESLFYMWRFTHDQVYRDRAWAIVQSIEKHCRSNETGAGYHGLEDVGSNSSKPTNRQESFFMAETLKYLYLIFADDDTIALEQYVFNTEAHPLSVRGHGRRSDPSKFVPLPTEYPVPPGTLNKKFLPPPPVVYSSSQQAQQDDENPYSSPYSNKPSQRVVDPNVTYGAIPPQPEQVKTVAIPPRFGKAAPLPDFVYVDGVLKHRAQLSVNDVPNELTKP
ncbi:hypothetical protein HDU78_005658 [Chytriomyces hyalinus]|nr:hypothetical protein HDU78_005658 [Chytriomyces hyalinus]